MDRLLPRAGRVESGIEKVRRSIEQVSANQSAASTISQLKRRAPLADDPRSTEVSPGRFLGSITSSVSLSGSSGKSICVTNRLRLPVTSK